MRRFAPLLLLILCGCPYQPPGPGPAPDPTPAGSPVEQAADKGMADYREAAANVCSEMRGKLTAFSKWDEFAKAWEKDNQAARVRSFGPYAEAINAALFTRNADGSWKTDGPIDVPKVEQVLRDAEAGLRGE